MKLHECFLSLLLRHLNHKFTKFSMICISNNNNVWCFKLIMSTEVLIEHAYLAQNETSWNYNFSSYIYNTQVSLCQCHTFKAKITWRSQGKESFTARERIGAANPRQMKFAKWSFAKWSSPNEVLPNEVRQMKFCQIKCFAKKKKKKFFQNVLSKKWSLVKKNKVC